MAHSHDHDHDHGHPHPHDDGPPGPPAGWDDGLDPANQSLADALRRSFAVLKALMLAMVAAYLLSGWFRVQPGEVGFVVRMGSVTGGTAAGVLQPGWHWSYPYPIDRVITVATQQERVLPVSFMFQLSEEEKMQATIRMSLAPLDPRRDDFLITGDANILHAQLVARYRIVDPVAYVSHVHDSSPGDSSPPEADLLTSLLRQSAIRVAASLGVKEIAGPKQREFLERVAEESRQRLVELATQDQPLGIEIVGLLAPQVAGVEAILAPRAVQEEFNRVVATEAQKIKKIDEATGAARELLNRTAGAGYERLAAAIDDEFVALAEQLSPADGNAAAAERKLAECREATDRLLEQASGRAQETINAARSASSRVVSEAVADAQQFRELLPEYQRDARFLMQRLRAEARAMAMSGENVEKWPFPRQGAIWLPIPREPESAKPKERQRPAQGFIDRDPLQTGPAQK